MNKRILIIIVVVLAVIVLFFLGIKNRKAPVSEGASSGSPAALVADAKAALEKSDLLSAKQDYKELINDYPSSNDVGAWQKTLEDINIRLLFSPTITAESESYEIKPGDTLTKIAKQFNTTVDLIMKSNNLASSNIMPGRQIKVWAKPFSVVVDKSQNILILKSGEEVIKTYVVSTGTNNSTPVGNFKIVNKLTDPTWFKAGTVVPAGSPENILGTRWMGIDVPGFGIHGTTQPQDLGKQVTAGCVRMANAEVEELYTILPVGAEVVIVD